MNSRIDTDKPAASTPPQPAPTVASAGFREHVRARPTGPEAHGGVARAIAERPSPPRRRSTTDGAAADAEPRLAALPDEARLAVIGFRLEPPRGAAGGAGERASVTNALAERYVESLRVGRVDARTHEVRLRLPGLHGAEAVEVRLRHEGGVLRASITSEDATRAQSLARSVQRELDAAGLATEPVSVAP